MHASHLKLIRVLESFLLICMIATPAWTSSDGLYRATAADGIKLKMRHYRPAPEAPFRTGAQPVLLFPGIAESMNQFLTHTPETSADSYQSMTLPSILADWAYNPDNSKEAYIRQDPMRYYSLAHYLWCKGYDVWLMNYRGAGKGDFRSEDGSIYTNLDVWAVMDTEPCIEKVYQETGQYPFIGGHSTGGFVCYAYLQGVTFAENLKTAEKNGYIPHVICDPALAASRNAKIKGFIGIDPGTTPPMPAIIDFPLMWGITGLPLYLDMEGIMGLFNELIPSRELLVGTLDVILGAVNALDRNYGYTSYLGWIIPYVDAMCIGNTGPYLTDYFFRQCLTGTYMRGASQWVDLGLQHAIREHWKNGSENKDLAAGPKPVRGKDGYYYYDQHMHRMTVPAMAVLSYNDSLVRASDVVEMIFDTKGHKTGWEDLDVYYLIPNTGHADIPMGLNAPYDVFPKIGAWLDRVCQADAASTGDTATLQADSSGLQVGSSQPGAGYSGSGSSNGMCFISCIQL